MTVRVIDFSSDHFPITNRRLSELPDRVVKGDPHHEVKNCFENETGDLAAGVWTSTPGKWHAFTDKDEYCYIISGHVRLISSDGEAQTFKTGDSFLIPNGFEGFWEVVETTTKHYVIRNYEG